MGVRREGDVLRQHALSVEAVRLLSEGVAILLGGRRHTTDPRSRLGLDNGRAPRH